MAFREKIELVIDLTTTSFTSGLRTLRRDIDDADGAFNKLKTAGGGAFDLIKQNAASFVLVAGTAIAGFGAKAVSDFQDVALGAGKLRDALGITAEEASQLQEVAGDLGIGVDAVATAVGRMNRTAASSPEAFDNIGAAIRRNKDGTIDVVATFESAAEAISRIPDAAKRAEAAQKIFGRGWQDIAELISSGADGIRDSMESVEKQKVVGDDQIRDARKFRDTLDELKGVGESLSVTVGQRLVPALTDAAQALITMIDLAKDVGGINIEGWSILDSAKWSSPLHLGREAFERLSGAVEDLRNQSDITATAADSFGLKIGDAGTAANAFEVRAAGARAVTEELGDEMADTRDVAKELAEDGIDRVTAAYDKMSDTISRDQSIIGLQGQFDELKVKAVESYTAVATKAADATEKTLAHRSSVNETKQAIIDYATELGNIPPNVVSDILAKVNRGELDAAWLTVNQLDGFTATVKLSADASQFNRVLTDAAGRARIPLKNIDAAEAGGTMHGPGGSILVGEKGPEIVNLPAGHQTIPANETARILNGGGNTYNVYAPTGNGDDIVRALRVDEWRHRVADQRAAMRR